MRVMICSDSGYPYIGGAETYVANLASGIVERGHEAHWLVSKMSKTNSFDVYKGIQIHRVPVLPIGTYTFPGRQSYAFTSILPALKLAKKMDIIQFDSFISSMTGWMIGKLARKPYILMYFELFSKLWKEIAPNPATKIIYPIIEKYISKSPYPKILTISNYTKNTLASIGVPENLIEVIYLGVDKTVFHHGYERKMKEKFKNKVLIGWAGRIKVGYSKNLATLLEAYKIVKRSIPNAVLVFDGSNFDKLIELVNNAGLELGKDVFYEGVSSLAELPYFYSSLDVYAMPSLSEGFGLAAVEAQACGTPVVCFNKGALPEVVKDGETGIVVRETTPQAYADGLIKILTNPQLREKMSKNTPQWVEKFDWDVTVEKHLNEYKNLIENWKK